MPNENVLNIDLMTWIILATRLVSAFLGQGVDNNKLNMIYNLQLPTSAFIYHVSQFYITL